MDLQTACRRDEPQLPLPELAALALSIIGIVSLRTGALALIEVPYAILMSAFVAGFLTWAAVRALNRGRGFTVALTAGATACTALNIGVGGVTGHGLATLIAAIYTVGYWRATDRAAAQHSSRLALVA